MQASEDPFLGLLASLAGVAVLSRLYVAVERRGPMKKPPSQLGNANLTASGKPSTVEASDGDVTQFLALPPEVRRQALRYAHRWRDGVSR